MLIRDNDDSSRSHLNSSTNNNYENLKRDGGVERTGVDVIKIIKTVLPRYDAGGAPALLNSGIGRTAIQFSTPAAP